MAFQSQKFIMKFDLFSKAFVFSIGKKKSKSTIIGGLLSFSIIVISVVYFYYLVNMYFQNKIEPRITSSITIENEQNLIKIDENFFIMEMLIQGEPLKRYEKRVGKKYLTYIILYEKYNPDGTSEQQSLPLVECTDPEFDGYLCISQSAFDINRDVFIEPINQKSADFAIIVKPCDQTLESNCASDEEIYKVILQQTNYFQIYTRIKQYNPTLRQYQNGYKSEFFYFDTQMIVFTRMSLIKATTSVIQGMIIQKTNVQQNIFDYKRIDTYFTKEGSYERMAIEGFAYIVFELNQVHNQIVIQHAMITEILAQFMSIFNSMLTVGILARLLAQSHIVEDMNNILLKEYYKKTALKLVQKREIRKKSINLSNGETTTKVGDATTRVGVGSSFQIIGKNTSMRDLQSERSKSHTIVETQKKIFETNFAEQQQQYFDLSLWDRLKIFIGKIRGKESIPSGKFDPNSDPIIYRSLLKQSMKRINIFEVYKDLIKLKMAIKLMLTKDQYAAIQFCGSDITQEDSIELTVQNKCKDVEEQNEQVTQVPRLTVECKNEVLLTPKQQTAQFITNLIALETKEVNLPVQSIENQQKLVNESENQQKQQENQIKEIKEEIIIIENIQQNEQKNNNDEQRSLQLQLDIENKQIICSKHILHNITENIEENSLYRIENKNQILQNFTYLNSQEFQDNEIGELYQDCNKNRSESQNKQTYLNFGVSSILMNEMNQSQKIKPKLEKEDHIQEWQIRGDSNVIEKSDISIQIKLKEETQKAQQVEQSNSLKNQLTQQVEQSNSPKNQLEKSNIIQQHVKCHLNEMDKIEEDIEEQEKFLKLFLIRMKEGKQNSDQISKIDQQIYSSLILNEQTPLVHIKTIPDQGTLNRIRSPSLENVRFFSRQVIDTPQANLNNKIIFPPKPQ